MTEYTPGEVKYKLATANEAIGEMALTYINELERINFRLQGENKQLKIDYNNLEKEISELKEQNIKDCESFNKTMKEIKDQWNKEHYQLIKAKEIIRKYYKYNPSCEYSYEDIDKEAEQFLKESE